MSAPTRAHAVDGPRKVYGSRSCGDDRVRRAIQDVLEGAHLETVRRVLSGRDAQRTIDAYVAKADLVTRRAVYLTLRRAFDEANQAVLEDAAANETHRGMGTTLDVVWLALIAFPATITGAWLGARAYRALSDRNFRDLVLALLFLSGAGLVWSSIGVR